LCFCGRAFGFLSAQVRGTINSVDTSSLRGRPVKVFLFLLAVAIGAIATFLFLRPGIVANSLGLAGNLSFDGDSGQLKQTAFVPTLDTPIPNGKSAVWCASFQLAWDKLKSDVVKGPVEITNAKEFCDRLNNAPPAAGDLPVEAYFAAAGKADDGILNKVRAEMGRKFPSVDISELNDFKRGILAFAYLETNVTYRHPYRVNAEQMLFAGSGKDGRPVASFGIPLEGELDVSNDTRDQGGVLFTDHRDPDTFAIDLDRHSQPNQIVLARIDRKATLGEALADADGRTKRYALEKHGPHEVTLSINDTLLVPNMHWRVRHQFQELLGPDKRLVVDGRELDMEKAEQQIHFRLDSHGAGVASSAEVRAKAGPRHFHFDRPFLLYLKKRDAERPFFVMWVENAEIMSSTGS
jgi:hypothetical protein